MWSTARTRGVSPVCYDLPVIDYIRLYAPTDASPTGKVALEYVKALLRIAPVRVISMSGPSAFTGPWEGYQRLAAVAKAQAESYVNAVCAPPDRWTFWMRAKMPNRDGSFEVASERVELWTKGVRNLLFATDHPSGASAEDTLAQLATAQKYDAIAVPTADLAAWWLAKGITAHVIKVPVEHNALRRLVLGDPVQPA